MSNPYLDLLWSRYTTSPDPVSRILSLHDTCSAFTRYSLNSSDIVPACGGFKLSSSIANSLLGFTPAVYQLLRLINKHLGCPAPSTVWKSHLDILIGNTGSGFEVTEEEIRISWVLLFNGIMSATHDITDACLGNHPSCEYSQYSSLSIHDIPPGMGEPNELQERGHTILMCGDKSSPAPATAEGGSAVELGRRDTVVHLTKQQVFDHSIQMRTKNDSSAHSILNVAESVLHRPLPAPPRVIDRVVVELGSLKESEVNKDACISEMHAQTLRESSWRTQHVHDCIPGHTALCSLLSRKLRVCEPSCSSQVSALARRFETIAREDHPAGSPVNSMVIVKQLGFQGKDVVG
ncbi:hypothetical protein C8R45DRAFT_932134 [Mycena sanguinolenta]|nr:hypothetical protein C8R45DRAFT_932134 [Mycena sanguinolenta]